MSKKRVIMCNVWVYNGRAGVGVLGVCVCVWACVRVIVCGCMWEL